MPYRSARWRLMQADTWLLELFLGLYTLVWGVGFANPLTETFASNPRSYEILAQIPGGEPVFGGLIMALGLLVLSTTVRASRRLRALTIGLAGGFWLVIGFAVAVPTDWASGGLPHFFLAALACWFCWTRLSYQGARR